MCPCVCVCDCRSVFDSSQQRRFSPSTLTWRSSSGWTCSPAGPSASCSRPPLATGPPGGEREGEKKRHTVTPAQRQAASSAEVIAVQKFTPLPASKPAAVTVMLVNLHPVDSLTQRHTDYKCFRKSYVSKFKVFRATQAQLSHCCFD